MAEAKVIIEGYTMAESGTEKSCATISLIKDKDIIMVVDPGVLESQNVLIEALEKEGLHIRDITHVGITHSHIDHYRNIGMFPEAKTVEFYGIWDRNMVEDWKEQFSENIKIIKTPGHSSTGISFIVNTKDGKIAVVGDIFWRENHPKKDPYADNPKKLEESRKKILESADWIIPGHAGIYKVKK